MSSILDALRKVEADERRKPIRLPPPEPRSRGRLAALVAAAAFVAGAGIVALVMFLRPGAAPEPAATEVASAPPVQPVPAPAAAPTPPPAPPAAVAPSAPPAPAAAPIAPPAATAPAPPAQATAPVAAPIAPNDAMAPAVAPASPAPVPAAPPAAAPGPVVDEPVGEPESDVPEQITILRPAPAEGPSPDAGAQAEVQVEALPAPAPVERPIDVLPGPPAGAPEIHVSFLIYSAVPARRQVSLTIDNGPLVTLHEGQKSGTISLVRILRDRIHVEHGGRTYSVRAVL